MTDLGYDVKYEPKIVYHNKGFLVNKWFDAWEKFQIDTFIPGGIDAFWTSGAFDHLNCQNTKEFNQKKFKKFKWPGVPFPYKKGMCYL